MSKQTLTNELDARRLDPGAALAWAPDQTESRRRLQHAHAPAAMSQPLGRIR